MARRKNQRRISEYGKQLQEKQKVKQEYALRERPFRNYYQNAAGKQDPTGIVLLINLEMRLDNVLYRSGFFKTRLQARQAITHGHIQVNDKKLNIPSYSVKIGDSFKIKKAEISSLGEQEIAKWIEVDQKKLTGKIKRQPERDEISQDFNEQLIVEFYSR